jgi:hypothetical protein
MPLPETQQQAFSDLYREIGLKRGRMPLAAIILSREANRSAGRHYKDTPYDRFLWEEVGAPSEPQAKAVEIEGVTLDKRVLSAFNLRRIVQVTGVEGCDMYAVKSFDISNGNTTNWTVLAPEKRKGEFGKEKTTLWIDHKPTITGDGLEPLLDISTQPVGPAQVIFTDGFPAAEFSSPQGRESLRPLQELVAEVDRLYEAYAEILVPVQAQEQTESPHLKLVA